jgi:asparagine synthase (glutamine-hydrolysing)
VAKQYQNQGLDLSDLIAEGNLGLLKEIKNSQFISAIEVDKLSLKQLVNNSIIIRLQSDVKVTTLMSGGVDSTIVTSIVNKLTPNIEAYFVDFDDKKLSENKWANFLAKRNNIDLKTILLNTKDLENSFKEYYSVFEEPFADYSGIPSIAIFKEVSKSYKVVLTGDGGDELFFGYPHYFKKYFLYCCFHILKKNIISNLLPIHIKRIIKGSLSDFESNYLKNHGIVSPFAASIIDNNFNQNIVESKSFLRGIIQYDRDFYNWPEKYLVKVDRSSMYSGIEVRSPFMDEKLCNKVKQIPLVLLFTPLSKKIFLKLVYFKFFGIKYFASNKQGFTPPIKELRKKNFQEKDFMELKHFLKSNCPNIYELIVNLSFEKIKNNCILFDRFFFFNEWRINENNNYIKINLPK